MLKNYDRDIYFTIVSRGRHDWKFRLYTVPIGTKKNARYAGVPKFSKRWVPLMPTPYFQWRLFFEIREFNRLWNAYVWLSIRILVKLATFKKLRFWTFSKFLQMFQNTDFTQNLSEVEIRLSLSYFWIKSMNYTYSILISAFCFAFSLCLASSNSICWKVTAPTIRYISSDNIKTTARHVVKYLTLIFL